MPLHPSNRKTTTGDSIIRSRLPAQDWFTIDEAAAASGWGRTFIRECINNGTLISRPCALAATRKPGRRAKYRIHADDLVLFIMRNGHGKYETIKLVSDAAAIIRKWPRSLQRWLIGHLSGHLDRDAAP